MRLAQNFASNSQADQAGGEGGEDDQRWAHGQHLGKEDVDAGWLKLVTLSTKWPVGHLVLRVTNCAVAQALSNPSTCTTLPGLSYATIVSGTTCCNLGRPWHGAQKMLV
jgi:hypothetical protein